MSPDNPRTPPAPRAKTPDSLLPILHTVRSWDLSNGTAAPDGNTARHALTTLTPHVQDLVQAVAQQAQTLPPNAPQRPIVTACLDETRRRLTHIPRPTDSGAIARHAQRLARSVAALHRAQNFIKAGAEQP